MDITIQAEKILIGSIILAPDKLVHVADTVKPEDFLCENAKKTYIIALSQWKNKEPVDAVSIITKDRDLVSYVTSAMSQGSGIGLKDQAMRVALKAKERRLNIGLTGISKSTAPIDSRLDDLLRLYQKEMFINKKDPRVDAVLDRFSEKVLENKKRGQLGVSTGFDFLEEKLIQYVPGHIWVMGAYTSVGKTAMMIQQVCNLLQTENCPKIKIISTEMTEEQVTSRILGNICGIYSQKILSGNLAPHEEEEVENYKRVIASKPLQIHDDLYELGDIETVFRKADLQAGIDIGFIDYVQNCRVSGLSKAYEAGEALSKSFQKLAKDVRCTLVCLSQVSNDVGRGNTDQLEFKNAGEWAAVADVGIHLKKKDRQLKYLLKKNRHGPLHEHMFEYSQNFSRLNPIKPL